MLFSSFTACVWCIYIRCSKHLRERVFVFTQEGWFNYFCWNSCLKNDLIECSTQLLQNICKNMNLTLCIQRRKIITFHLNTLSSVEARPGHVRFHGLLWLQHDFHVVYDSTKNATLRLLSKKEKHYHIFFNIKFIPMTKWYIWRQI